MKTKDPVDLIEKFIESGGYFCYDYVSLFYDKLKPYTFKPMQIEFAYAS